MTNDPPIRFEEFMHRALYDPAKGYYARHINDLGPRGDFTTVPLKTDILAQSIARWIVSGLRETQCRNVIEIGPGTGQLAQSVRQHIPWHIRTRTRFHLVETSPPLRNIQQNRLASSARWHDSPHSALADCHGRALIYSNELVDAFPVRRFQQTSTGWRELGVHLTPSAPPREALLSPSSLPDSSSFSQPHPAQQIIEIHESYQRWLTSWLPLWSAGRMLTIDYGNTADLLYHRRPHGTLRAYLLHQPITGPGIYENIGRQDLTADVNFTDLMRWSHPWMSRQHLTNLSDFCGKSAPAWLHEPDGPGHAFLVLDEQRDAARIS